MKFNGFEYNVAKFARKRNRQGKERRDVYKVPYM